MLPQKKTNSNCCTAALAAYILSFSASYYLHSPSTAPGTHYRRSAWTCWGLRQRLVAACAEFQHSDWLVSKRLEACISTEGGHCEHLPDIPVATHHNRFFSEPPMTTHNWLSLQPPVFLRTQQTFSHMKKFCNSQVSAVTFLGGVGKWITVCFLLR